MITGIHYLEPSHTTANPFFEIKTDMSSEEYLTSMKKWFLSFDPATLTDIISGMTGQEYFSPLYLCEFDWSRQFEETIGMPKLCFASKDKAHFIIFDFSKNTTEYEFTNQMRHSWLKKMLRSSFPMASFHVGIISDEVKMTSYDLNREKNWQHFHEKLHTSKATSLRDWKVESMELHRTNDISNSIPFTLEHKREEFDRIFDRKYKKTA